MLQFLHYSYMNRTSLLALIAEMGPLVSFFIAGQFTDFFGAVSILMVTTFLAVGLSWRLGKRIPWLPIVSAAFVLLGGFITLYFEDPNAIIFADTLYYACIGSTLGISIYYKKPLLKKLFGSVFAITDSGWRRLTWRWCIFLLLAAAANELARNLLTPESWIDYRFYKSFIIVVFALLQFQLSAKTRLPRVSNKWGLRIQPDDIKNNL